MTHPTKRPARAPAQPSPSTVAHTTVTTTTITPPAPPAGEPFVPNVPSAVITAAPESAQPAVQTVPEIVRCRDCRFGRDLSLGPDARRCRHNPPFAKFESRTIGHSSGAFATAYWPIVNDNDYCSKGEKLP